MMREYDINLIPDDVLERETLIERGRMWLFTSIDKAINHNIILTHLEIMSQYSYTQKGINQGAGKGGYFSNAAPVKVSGGKDNVVIIRGMSQSNSDLAAMLAELSEDEIYTSVNL